MIKLWKVKVNNWGWDNPRTIYETSRKNAIEIGQSFPACDGVQYAGKFTDDNARRLLGVGNEYNDDY